MPISAADAPKPLPKQAKDIYVSAWNAAYSGTCKTRSDRDECASKIAWAAVKEKYKKEGESWVAKAATGTSSTANLPHGTGSQFGQTASALEGSRHKCKCPKCGKKATSEEQTCSDKECPECGSRMESVGSGKAVWIKSATEGTIGGYLVMWGSPEQKDLVDEYFTKDTDFWLDRWSRRPLLYQHGLDHTLKGTGAIVGTVDTYELDDIGLWIEAQLDTRHRFKQAIETLINEKALNLSSGALPRFVERSPDGFIKTWPIVEATLTPTPAEYRLADVVLVKAAFEAIGEELKEVDNMDEEKTLWQRFGERLGFVTSEEELESELDSAKAAPKKKDEEDDDEEEGKDREKEKEEEKKSTPFPEFVLDESAVKAISAQVVGSMSKALEEVIVPLRKELDELKTWREEVATRLDATEKTIHDKALEIVENLPPIVKVRATEVKTTETDEEPTPPALIEPAGPTDSDIQKWAELFSGIVERGLAQGDSGPMQI